MDLILKIKILIMNEIFEDLEYTENPLVYYEDLIKE